MISVPHKLEIIFSIHFTETVSVVYYDFEYTKTVSILLTFLMIFLLILYTKFFCQKIR